MPPTAAPVLIVATAAPSEAAVSQLAKRFVDRPVIAAYLGDDAESWPAGERWTRWTRGDVEDLAALRTAFLEFLDSWPRQSFGGATGNKSFDEAFRLADGYSLWWTGPGVARHPDHGIFTQLRDIWSIAAAIGRSQCGSIVLVGKDAQVAKVVVDRCKEDGIAIEVPTEFASPAQSAWSGRVVFFLAAVADYFVSPFVAALRAFVCRRRVRYKMEPPSDRGQPAVVMTSLFPREFRLRGEKGGIAFWKEVSDELKRAAPAIRLRHFLHTTTDRFGALGQDRLHCHRAWPELRKLDGLAPLPNQTVAWGAWLTNARHFVTTLVRYCRLERREEFRHSFRFGGYDVAALYVPLLRKAVGQTHEWSQKVAAATSSLRTVGNVRAVLLMGEMYPMAMPMIAAARSLGIPTIGVQHGTIFPMHLIYTVPKAQVESAPTPDRFAIYGEFAEETLTKLGQFPKDRAIIVGSPRFDHLIREPLDSSAARRQLDLPSDKSVVLFATQVYPWFKTAAQALFESVRARDDVVVCVKAHPHDRSFDEYRRLAAETHAVKVRFFFDRFEKLLAACDVLVSGSSTAMLEGILLGRRTICINFSNEPDRYPYVEEGGSLGAKNAEQLSSAIQTALDRRSEDDADRERFLVRHLGPSIQGQAASAFVQLVLETIGATAVNEALKTPSAEPFPTGSHPASPK
jgi:surface carbohydrate biosynthesis protein (TIGR04326 family)